MKIVSAATAVTVLALAAGGLVPTASTAVVPTATEDPPATIEGLPRGPQQITLVTGDRVVLNEAGSEHSVRVEGAPRSGGGALWFRTVTAAEGTYVLPSDAQPAIQAGLLDKELFNVEYLAANGYTDAQTKQIPVLVGYPAARSVKSSRASLAAQADRLPATSKPVGLTSINGAGIRVEKASATAFWEQLRGSRVGTLGAGLAKVWLNRKVKVNLAESVPLIGAPAAWEAGYDGTGVKVAVLDTGIDANHPDVAGKVAGSKSFVDDPVPDGQGHGTHVAATIAGSGAASAGSRKGVAPGAQLLIGKVLNNAGSGDFESVIAGMEWAATEQQADVVSMSLGACCSDGSDAASVAVNNLTASTGALFVVAAGNDGPTAETISSPGSADSALTVAATNKQDALAGFSSRGPRPGNQALKPEIAAPGVDIIAARAAGTSLGTPVDENYSSLSGTSMATPHVAGAAAILAQRHPDWQAAQLKAALMSTAHDVTGTVYQVGAGRVDVARAVRQQVFTTTASIDLGRVEKAAEGTPTPPITKQVTYTNLSQQAVTLTLSANLRDAAGQQVPTGAVTTDPSITVPAGGTATTSVTVAPHDLAQQQYTGAVVATDESTGTRVTTPIGMVLEPKKFTLTVRTLGRDGKPLTPQSQDTIDVSGPNGIDFGDDVRLVDTGVTQVSVFPGTYSVAQLAAWADGDNRLNGALLSNPEVSVTGDTEITLDARTASEITFATPKPSGPLNNVPSLGYQRTTTAGQTFGAVINSFAPIGSWVRLWASPTDQVRTGKFRFWTQRLLGVSEVAMSVRTPDRRVLPIVVPLHGSTPTGDGSGETFRHQDYFPGWVPFTGTRDLRLVDVGDGTEADLAKVDAKGRLALLRTGHTTENQTECGLDIDRVRAVKAAGAAGIIAYPAADHECAEPVVIPLQLKQKQLTGEYRSIDIPNVALSTAEGQTLQRQLGKRAVTIRTQATPETPYTYALKAYEDGKISKSLRYRLTDRNLGQVRLDYHATTPTHLIDYQYIRKADDAVDYPLALSSLAAASFVGPHSYTEYFGPTSKDVYRVRTGYGRQGGDAPEGYTHRVFRTAETTLFDKSASGQEQWYVAPRTPGVTKTADEVHRLVESPGALQMLGNCYFCRQGNTLWGAFTMTTGAPGRQQSSEGALSFSPEEGPADFDVRLYRGDQEIRKTPAPWPVFELPEEQATYRMTGHSAKTDVAWTFTSGKPGSNTRRSYHCLLDLLGSSEPCAPEPMVFAGYDLGRDLTMANQIPDRGLQRFTVHAYHSDSKVAMPKIAGLKLWLSYDQGKNWRSVVVRPQGNGNYEALAIHLPARLRASNQVSLRVEAWDTAGNRVDQVTRDAFTLQTKR